MSITKGNWVDVSNEPLSEIAVRELYKSSKPFRIYTRDFPSGTVFHQTVGFAATIYVLTGMFTYENGEHKTNVLPSEFIKLGAGNYGVTISPDNAASYVIVLEVPTKFNNTGDNMDN